jgi:uncharacterized phage protein (TIGR02218 family)
MPRNVPTALTTIVASDLNQPVELYEVALDDQTYYYANAEQDITLGSQVYTALAISRTRVGTSMDSKVDEISVQLDNVDLGFSQLVASKDLQGRNVTIKKVFRDYLGDTANIITLFDGRMDSIAIDQQKILIRIVSWLDAILKKYPGRVYQQQCNYKFGDTWCAIDKESAANKTIGTAEATSTAMVLVDTALNQADGYWDDGFVQISAGTNVNLGRPIRSFAVVGGKGNVTLRLGFPQALDATSQYIIYRGCNKTKDACINKYDNWLKYGGFTTVPRKPAI